MTAAARTPEDRSDDDREVVLITGSAKGIGRALALRLGTSSVRVSILGRSAERGEHLVREIVGFGGEASFIAADLREPGSAERAVQEAVMHFGALDAAVNCAAAVHADSLGRLHELEQTSFETALVGRDRMAVRSGEQLRDGSELGR